MSVKLQWGWVIQDQATVVPGIGFGPGWLQGRRRTGPLGGGYHNLIFKDILFFGKGKGALDEIIKQMSTMTNHKVRCGIRPGMRIEKFVGSEYGGGDDQITVEATESDIVRNPYYVYVFPNDKSAYHFNSLTGMLVNTALGFVPAANKATETARAAIIDAGGTALGLRGSNKTDLRRACDAKEVFVHITGRRDPVRRAIIEHRHTHRLSTISQEIVRAVQNGL